MLELNYNQFTNKDFTASWSKWLPNSLFTNLPSIRRYTASANERVLK